MSFTAITFTKTAFCPAVFLYGFLLKQPHNLSILSHYKRATLILTLSKVYSPLNSSMKAFFDLFDKSTKLKILLPNKPIKNLHYLAFR